MGRVLIVFLLLLDRTHATSLLKPDVVWTSPLGADEKVVTVDVIEVSVFLLTQ